LRRDIACDDEYGARLMRRKTAMMLARDDEAEGIANPPVELI
jgi:hypothetical protein